MVDEAINVGGLGFQLEFMPDDQQVTGKDLKGAFGEHVEIDHADVTGTEIRTMLDDQQGNQATMKWIIEFLFGKVTMNPITGDRSFDGSGILSDFVLAQERGEKPQIVIRSAQWEPSSTTKWALGSALLLLIGLMTMLVWAAVVMITGQPIDPPGIGL